jgi:hypothetical protein
MIYAFISLFISDLDYSPNNQSGADKVCSITGEQVFQGSHKFSYDKNKVCHKIIYKEGTDTSDMFHPNLSSEYSSMHQE